MSSLAARESGGGCSPGLYLPVSTPCASGDHTICEMPCFLQKRMSSASGARQSMLYCGCDDTHLRVPGTSRPAWICSTVHSEKPISRTLPCSTTSVSASMVSSIGVSGSARWH
jgi:hypothetical protein